MRKNKVWDLTVAESITHIICEPGPALHVLQGIRRPHDYTGLHFTDDKQTTGQAGNRVQRKPGPLAKGKVSNYVPMKEQYKEMEVSSEPVTKAQNKEWLYET